MKGVLKFLPSNRKYLKINLTTTAQAVVGTKGCSWRNGHMDRE
jgi:hypothetical protein